MGNKKNYVTTTKSFSELTSIIGLTENMNTSKLIPESFPDLAKASKKLVGATISGDFEQTLSSLANMNELSAGVDYSKLLSESFSNFAKKSKINNILAGIKINNDGTINCLDERNIDVEKSINEIEDILIENPKIPLYNKIDKFKIHHIIIWVFIYFWINALFIQPATDLVKEKSMMEYNNLFNQVNNEKIIAKKIKKPVYAELKKQITNKNIRNAIINNYRFVTTNDLNVRSSNSIKSSSIYKLSLGQVVRILHKNWTRIEYENEDGSIIICGWVNTRYISKFK